jgi:hypothetical protein
MTDQRLVCYFGRFFNYRPEKIGEVVLEDEQVELRGVSSTWLAGDAIIALAVDPESNSVGGPLKAPP